MSDTESPLLALLEQRWKEVIQHIPDPTPERPSPRPTYEKRIVDAGVRAHAEANNSDPFAAARIKHYIRQGYVLPSEARDDGLRQTQARRSAGATFPTVNLA